LSSAHALIKVLKGIAYVTLSGMVLVTTANVFGRYIFKKPILGEYDMVELGMAILGGSPCSLLLRNDTMSVSMCWLSVFKPCSFNAGKCGLSAGICNLGPVGLPGFSGWLE